MSGQKTCGIERMEKALAEGGQVVDVREPSETRAAAVAGTIEMPLSEFDRRVTTLDRKKPVFLLCRTGARARDAACRLSALGYEDVQVVDGGLKEWIEAGKTVVCRSRIWSLERQVRFAAGALVLAGVGLSFVKPAFILLAAFVAAGQIYSASSDTCGMAMVLSRMPWNRK